VIKLWIKCTTVVLKGITVVLQWCYSDCIGYQQSLIDPCIPAATPPPSPDWKRCLGVKNMRKWPFAKAWGNTNDVY
jgi:hypothetical protein